MNYKNYISRIDRFKTSLKEWKTYCFLQTVIILLLCFVNVKIGLSQKVILVPSSLRGDIWLEGNELSDDYLLRMGEEFFNFLLNYNPSNILFRYEKVLKSVSAEKYQELRAQLMVDVDRIKKNSISSSFYPIEMKVNRLEKKILIKGDHLRTIGREIVGRKEKVFSLTYSLREGFKVLSYESEKKYY